MLNRKLLPLGFSIDENSKTKGHAQLLRHDRIRKLKPDKVREISRYNPGFEDFVRQMDARLSKSEPDVDA